MTESRSRATGRTTGFCAIAAICAVIVFLVTALLMSIFERKQEAKNPYVRLVEVNEETTDPAAWGVNWAREYDDYKRTAEVSRDTIRRIRGAARGKGHGVPMAHAHVRRLRLRDRLPRSPRPRLHAAGPGADQARHRAPAARLLPALPRVGHPDLPTPRRRRCLQGLRSAGQAVVRRSARRSRQDRLVEPCCRRNGDDVPARRWRPPGELRRLPRSAKHGAARHPARVHPRHPGARRGNRADASPREHRALAARKPFDALRSERRRLATGDALVRLRPVPRRVLLRPEDDAVLSLEQRA